LAEEARRTAEATRLAEEARRAADATRLAEEARRTAEATRLAEEARMAAEATRLAEEARMAAEATRLGDEARRAAEATRLAEEARRTAEATRLAEEARRAAEAGRLAEEARLAAEATRLAEEARMAAEATRLGDEARRAAEATRLAEEARRTAEATRVAEEARRAAEAARAAEQARQAAEAARVAEEARQAAEAARLAEEARQAAEAARAAEQARQAAEAARLAEEARQAAEAVRAAEQARQAAEAARAAEEAQRARRVAADAARFDAEDNARFLGMTPAQIEREGAEAWVRAMGLAQGLDATRFQNEVGNALALFREEEAARQWQARLDAGTRAGAQAAHQAAIALRDANLARNESFTTDPLFLVLTFRARDEYNLGHGVVTTAQAAAGTPGTWRVNLAYLCADPFLKHHNLDPNERCPNDVTGAQWTAVKDGLTGCNGAPAPSLRAVFDRIDFESNAVLQQSVKKRFKSLCDTAQERTLAHNGTDATPLQELALAISQNGGRCIDGVGDWLNDYEPMFYNTGEMRFAHMGEFISGVLADDRHAFIQRHTGLDANAEFVTTAAQLLKHKMLYSLGLRGKWTRVRYGGIMGSNHAILASNEVMRRFLNGEANVRLAQHFPAVTFEAYTVDRMVQLLQATRENARPGARPPKGARKLRVDMITAECVRCDMNAEGEWTARTDPDGNFIAKDPLLAPLWIAYMNSLVMGEDPPPANTYFEVLANGHVRLTREFWLHLLDKYGYITRVP
jgi:hypothetical protein